MKKSVNILVFAALLALFAGGGCQNWSSKWSGTVDFDKGQIPGNWTENNWNPDKNPVKKIGAGRYEFTFTAKENDPECKILCESNWDKPGFNCTQMTVGSETNLSYGERCFNNIKISGAKKDQKYKITFTLEGVKLKAKVEQI